MKRFIDPTTRILSGKCRHLTGLLITGQQNFPGQGRLSDCAILFLHPVGQESRLGGRNIAARIRLRLRKQLLFPHSSTRGQLGLHSKPVILPVFQHFASHRHVREMLGNRSSHLRGNNSVMEPSLLSYLQLFRQWWLLIYASLWTLTLLGRAWLRLSGGHTCPRVCACRNTCVRASQRQTRGRVIRRGQMRNRGNSGLPAWGWFWESEGGATSLPART